MRDFAPCSERPSSVGRVLHSKFSPTDGLPGVQQGDLFDKGVEWHRMVPATVREGERVVRETIEKAGVPGLGFVQPGRNERFAGASGNGEERLRLERSRKAELV